MIVDISVIELNNFRDLIEDRLTRGFDAKSSVDLLNIVGVGAIDINIIKS